MRISSLVRGIGHFVIVSVGVIALTSLSIDATQYLSGSQSALGIFSRTLLEDECPEHTAMIEYGVRSFCVDQYEASPQNTCPYPVPSTAIQSKENLDTPKCLAVSLPDALPWTNVTYLQAKSLCAKRGGRLLSNAEWYLASEGTPDTASVCNVTSAALAKAGSYSDCVSYRHTYDAVGNAWEWVDASIIDGVYGERLLPENGYVATADADGVAVTTTPEPSILMNDDYAWSSKDGVLAMMRGGFFRSDTDAGLFALHADVPLDFASPGTGFRCVFDL